MSLAAMTATTSKSIFKTYDRIQNTDEKSRDKNPYGQMGNTAPFKTIDIDISKMGPRGQSASHNTRYKNHDRKSVSAQ